jgi:hypothetical protein
MKISQQYSNWISNCPIQDQGFGQSKFYHGDGFSCRYIEKKKYMFRQIYIVYGPNIKDMDGFNNFLSWLDSFRFTLIKIDLYKIFFDIAEGKIIDLLTSRGFKKDNYWQEDKTLLIYKDDYSPNSRSLKYVRSVERKYDIEILSKDNVDQDLLQDCFDIHNSSCIQKGYSLKSSLAYFNHIIFNQSGYLAVAKDKESGQIEGFILSDVRTISYKSKHLKLMYLIFTAMTQKGREDHVGFGFTHRMIEFAFNKEQVNFIDFLGLGGSHGIFKTKFSSNDVVLSGSYQKIQFF